MFRLKNGKELIILKKKTFRNVYLLFWFFMLLLPLIMVFFSVFRTGDITTAISWLNSDFFGSLYDIPIFNDFIEFLKHLLFNNITLGTWFTSIFNLFIYYTFVNLIGLFFGFINWIIELCKGWFNGISKEI